MLSMLCFKQSGVPLWYSYYLTRASVPIRNAQSVNGWKESLVDWALLSA